MLKVLGRVAAILLAIVGLASIGVGFFMWRELEGLPEVRNLTVPVPGQFLCHGGQADGGPETAIPPIVRAAFIAAEDPEFDRRPPLTPGTVLADVLGKSIPKHGAFTNVVVRCLLTSRGDWRGRQLRWHIQGLVLTLRVEAEVSKDRILATALGVMPLGQGIFGVDAATRAYFGKAPGELTHAEAAYLAGLGKSPSLYAKDDGQGLARRNAVLARMAEMGVMTPEQSDAAKAQPLGRIN